MLPSLGIIFHPTFPPETLADFSRQAEAAGFDELWLWGLNKTWQRLVQAGADTLVFQPLDGDPACLDEYARYLMPRLELLKTRE